MFWAMEYAHINLADIEGAKLEKSDLGENMRVNYTRKRSCLSSTM
jgi:hypothetical protein